MSQTKDGNIIAASTIKELSIQSPVTEENIEISLKYMKRWEADPGKALGLFLSGERTKNSYIMVRSSTKANGFNYYPNYNKIRQAKQNVLF